jgi:ankyrin repeat protein
MTLLSHLLLANGADANSRDDDGRTLLLRAIDAGHESIVILLQERTGQPLNIISS